MSNNDETKPTAKAKATAKPKTASKTKDTAKPKRSVGRPRKDASEAVKSPRMDTAMKDFILDKMSEGMTIAEIYRKHPTKCVHPKSVYRKSLLSDEWKEALDEGYTLFMYNKLEEMHLLGSGLASEIYPDVDFREAEAALKRRIDVLKFSAAKVAPILSKRFEKTSKLEVTGDAIGGQMVIMNYSTEALPPAKGDVIDVDKDED